MRPRTILVVSAIYVVTLLGLVFSWPAALRHALPFDWSLVLASWIGWLLMPASRRPSWRRSTWGGAQIGVVAGVSSLALFVIAFEFVVRSQLGFERVRSVESLTGFSSRALILSTCLVSGAVIARYLSNVPSVERFLRTYNSFLVAAGSLVLAVALFQSSQGVNTWDSDAPVGKDEIWVFASNARDAVVDVTYGWERTADGTDFFSGPLDASGGVKIVLTMEQDRDDDEPMAWVAIPAYSTHSLRMASDSARFVGIIDEEQLGDCGSELGRALPSTAMLVYAVEMRGIRSVVRIRGDGKWSTDQGSAVFFQPPGVAFFGGDDACSALSVPGFGGYDFAIPNRTLRTQMFGALQKDAILERVSPQPDDSSSESGNELVWVTVRNEPYWAFASSPFFRASTGTSRGRSSALLFLSGILVGVATGSVASILTPPALPDHPANGSTARNRQRPRSAARSQSFSHLPRRRRRP